MQVINVWSFNLKKLIRFIFQGNAGVGGVGVKVIPYFG
jgi:hypothetical protein